MAIGAAVTLSSSVFLLFWGTSIPALVIGTALLGAGQLACVVGQQAVVANNAASSRMDSAFGYLTFAASLGQALGPLAISLVGGTSIRPDTQAIFLLSACMSLALFVTTFGVSAKVSARRRMAKAAGSPGGTLSLLRTPGVLQALATSAAVLAVVDLTVVYLPALGTERGLTAATVGFCSRCGPVSPWSRGWAWDRVSRLLGRTRLMVLSLVISTVALAVAAIPMPRLAAVCGHGRARAGPGHRPAPDNVLAFLTGPGRAARTSLGLAARRQQGGPGGSSQRRWRCGCRAGRGRGVPGFGRSSAERCRWSEASGSTTSGPSGAAQPDTVPRSMPPGGPGSKAQRRG